jgi:predicted naringenin-chalcone synthase
LFGDGFIRYSLQEDTATGLEVLALDERILPESADSMTWTASDCGLQMTLARDVPQRLEAELRSFVSALFERSGLDLARDLRRSVAAVHPGGPRIIDGVREALEIGEAQVAISRGVLYDYGNMSSATLPHVWQRIVDDERIPPGTPILSLAFGPGLTLCGGIFRVRRDHRTC